MLRMMCVTAHPDDEAGNFGGALALYHERGVETCVLCLTPGQAATHRGGARNDVELAAIRRREFEASCRVLGVSRGIVLDYADGQLHRLDLYSVVCEVTRHIRECRPHVVLAYGPEGGVTAHLDHAMASVFTTLAVQWAGRSNRYPDHFLHGLAPHQAQKLYYCTSDFTLAARQPVTLSPVTAVLQLGKHLEAKIAAFHSHASQSPLFPIFDNHVRPRGAVEMYHLAASATPGPAAPETDLFAGVKET